MPAAKESQDAHSAIQAAASSLGWSSAGALRISMMAECNGTPIPLHATIEMKRIWYSQVSAVDV